MVATFLFFPEAAFGPTNNCVGIGNVLQQRGHRVVFVVEESFAGTLAARGFEERLVQLAPPPETPQAPGQFWKDFVRDTSPIFRRPTIEALAGFVQPTFQALCDGATVRRPAARRGARRGRPRRRDRGQRGVVPGRSWRAGKPWVRIMSCNPLELPDPDLPPVFSGYPTDDRRDWAGFRAEAEQARSARCTRSSTRPAAIGVRPRCRRGSSSTPRTWLNLGLYPTELDYVRSQPLPDTWHSLPANVRDSRVRLDADGRPRRPVAPLGLPQPRLARQRRPAADAAAGRRCWR